MCIPDAMAAERKLETIVTSDVNLVAELWRITPAEPVLTGRVEPLVDHLVLFGRRQLSYFFNVERRGHDVIICNFANADMVGHTGSVAATIKAVETLEMGEGNEVGVYITPGVGHGFYALTPVVMTYLVDQEFDGSDEFGVRFDDPTLAIPWPDGDRIVSERDRANPAFTEISAENLPE